MTNSSYLLPYLKSLILLKLIGYYCYCFLPTLHSYPNLSLWRATYYPMMMMISTQILSSFLYLLIISLPIQLLSNIFCRGCFFIHLRMEKSPYSHLAFMCWKEFISITNLLFFDTFISVPYAITLSWYLSYLSILSFLSTI